MSETETYIGKGQGANVEGNDFKSIPKQLKEKALHRVMMGEIPTQVANDIGCHPSTLLRWMKKEGVERGQALAPEANPMVGPVPDRVMNGFLREVRKQNVDAALNMFLQMQDGVEDKYRVLMAQQLYQIFHTVMQNPPQIRNWGDVEKAHRIMGDILGFKEKGGRSAKIQIQFEQIKEKPVTVKVENIEEKDEIPGGNGD